MVETEQPQFVPLWYQGMYQLGAQRLHIAIAIEQGTIRQPDDSDFEPPTLRRAAIADAARLLRTTALTLLWLQFQFRRISLHGREWWSERWILWEALSENIEPSAALLLAGALMESDAPTRTETEDGLSRRDLLRMPREELEAKSPWTLEEFARNRPRVSPRARYNHACFLATAAAKKKRRPSAKGTDDSMEQAAVELRRSLREADPALRRRLAAWGLADPTLKPLREGKPEFVAELARHAPPPS
jgi:hypothetical protein